MTGWLSVATLFTGVAVLGAAWLQARRRLLSPLTPSTPGTDYRTHFITATAVLAAVLTTAAASLAVTGYAAWRWCALGAVWAVVWSLWTRARTGLPLSEAELLSRSYPEVCLRVRWDRGYLIPRASLFAPAGLFEKRLAVSAFSRGDVERLLAVLLAVGGELAYEGRTIRVVFPVTPGEHDIP